ncbi:MAG: phage protein Gp36 family protein [Ghiorsea sp.]
MSYAAVADMVAMYGASELTQLTDTNGSGVPNDAVVQLALDDASSEADGYLMPKLPNTASRALVRHVAAIARFYLHKDIASDEIRERYNDALAWLKLAAKGVVSYDDAPSVVGAGSSAAAVVSSMATPYADANTILRNMRQGL